MPKKGVKLKICQVSEMNAVNILITVRLVVFLSFLYLIHFIVIVLRDGVLSSVHTHAVDRAFHSN